MDNFFPTEDYKLPVSSNYMKFIEGENGFRILSSAIIGWEYWNTEGKPVRLTEKPDTMPIDMRHENGLDPLKHFWAFVVWNYTAKKVQILELTQKGIMKDIESLVKNTKWGNPREYDIVVTRTGSGLDTEYRTLPDPKTPVDDSILAAYENTPVELSALYRGEDPFKK